LFPGEEIKRNAQRRRSNAARITQERMTNDINGNAVLERNTGDDRAVLCGCVEFAAGTTVA
jgi:hypothetical protein